MHRLLQLSPVVLVSLAAFGLAACGGSTTGATTGPATTAPTTAPTATAAPVSVTCPTAAVLNAALSLAVTAPRQTPTTGNPPGDSGVSCEYTSSDFKDVVILIIGTGPVRENFFSTVEAGEQSAATKQGLQYSVTSVSGVGDKADSVKFVKGGSPYEDGILAESSNSGIVLTVVPAVSESQLEAFASQLLG